MLEWFGLLWQQPWYALTALAVAIPIIIHLLNPSRGKLVTFAHVALLSSTQAQPTAELRLTQRVLLVLRLLLLLIAAALLAKPWWPQTSNHEQIIMLSQDWLNTSSANEKQQVATRLGTQQAILIDSPAAPELRQNLSSDEILNWQEQTPSLSINLWSKISSHAASIDAQSPVVVYATNRASQFVGAKVAIVQPLEWQVIAINKPNKTTPEPLSVMLVYQNDRQRDVSYLSAALSALQKQSSVQIQLNSLSETAFTQQLTANNLPQAQLILWLSSAPLAPELLASQQPQITIVMDAPKQGDNQQWQLAFPTPLMTKFSGDVLSSSANSAFDARLSQVLWHTSQDLPLLAELNTEHTKLLQFYSRFNPHWNNLVELPAFPLILGELIHRAMPQQQRLNQHVIDIQQIIEKTIDSDSQQTHFVHAYEQQRSQLASLLAALLFVLFCLERLYSEKRSRTLKTTTVEGADK